MKPLDSFLLVGRFQTFHKGHESLVEAALSFCDRGLILVGSGQEHGTLRNPYDVVTRVDMIREVFGDQVMVRGMSDMTNENDIPADGSWGRYVMAQCKIWLHKLPELMVYGNDESRSGWFSKSEISWAELILPRSRIPISGTEMRDMMLRDNDEWMSFVHPRLHKFYPRLRRELLSVPAYREQYEDILKFGTPLRGWEDHEV